MTSITIPRLGYPNEYNQTEFKLVVKVFLSQINPDGFFGHMNEGNLPQKGSDETAGLGSPRANLLVPDLVALDAPPLPPFHTVFVDLAELYGYQDLGTLDGSLTSPSFPGVLAQPMGAAMSSVSSAFGSVAPTEGNLGGTTMVYAGNESDGSTCWSTNATQSSGSPDSITSTLGVEHIQWAGINAALEILNA